MAKFQKLILASLVLALTSLTASQSQPTTTTDYSKLATKIVELVDHNFYSPEIYKSNFKQAAQTLIDESSKIDNLADLALAANRALSALKSSHCQFVTEDEEIYYFLESLFKSMAGKPSSKIAVPGFVCGGAGFDRHQVRYVLDGTAAASRGILVGDMITSVNDISDWSYGDIVKNGDKDLSVKVQRGDKHLTFVLKCKPTEIYPAYVTAMRRSIKFFSRAGKTLGYVHVYAGGALSHDALEEIIMGTLIKTDGLILDLRDGYGASDLTDLDVFNRPAKNYPVMVSKGHSGKSRTIQYFYDRPLVVMINGGARSGKEILAYALKQSKRATLVGTNTAGYVVAGRLFNLNEHCALYLAVNDITLNGERLEGKGVAPDIVVKNDEHTDAGYQHQLDVAIATLEKQLSQKGADLR